MDAGSTAESLFEQPLRELQALVSHISKESDVVPSSENLLAHARPHVVPRSENFLAQRLSHVVPSTEATRETRKEAVEEGSLDDEDDADENPEDDAEENTSVYNFYEESLDEFCACKNLDQTIEWCDLTKRQRKNIINLCRDRDSEAQHTLVTTEWPSANAPLGKLCVSWGEHPQKRNRQGFTKNRQR
jgi:hypothetical protein